VIRHAVIAKLLFSALAATGQTVTIDFEEVASTPSTVPVVSSKGFLISNPVGVFLASGPSYCLPECPGGSGHYVIAQGTLPTGPVTLQRADGAEFSLISFDFAETNVGIPYPPEIRVDGITSSGETISFVVALDGINDGSGPLVDFQRASLPANFRRLRTVTFAGLPGVLPGHLERFNYSLDNIQVGPALGPISIPMLNSASLCIFAFLLLIAGGAALHVRPA